MLLLNIVRASKAYPMYFTTFSDMKGNLTWTVGTGNIAIPFATVEGKAQSGSAGVYSVAPNGSLSSNPIYSVALSNTKDFLQGMFTPVTPDVLYSYWQQGWPRELLLYLFVGRIEHEINNPEIKLDDDPDNRAIFENFRKEVHDIAWREEKDTCEFVSNTPEDDIGPEIDAKLLSTANLKNLVKAQEAKLKLEKKEEGKNYQLTAPQEDEYFLKCPCKANDANRRKYQLYSFASTKPKGDEKSVGGKVKVTIDPITHKTMLTITVDTGPTDTGPFEVSAETKFAGGYDYESINDVKNDDSVIVGFTGKDTKKVATSVSKSTRVMLLRSPEAMLYYLGEIMRFRAFTGESPFTMAYPYPSQCKERPIELFTARQLAYRSEKDSPVVVNHEGLAYIIPRPVPDQQCPITDESMHVLSLMSLLIAKQQSASQLPPPTGVTTSIGGK